MGDDDTQGAQDPTWSVEATEKLIDTIREKKILYVTGSKDNKNSGKKELEWQNIAIDLQREVDEVKKRWKYLRGQYQRILNSNKGKSGNASKKQTTWPFFSYLAFLKDHVAGNSSSTGNMEKGPAPVDDNNVSLICEEDGKDSEAMENNNKKRMKVADKLDVALLNYVSNAEVKDSDYHFCMSLAEKLRKLNPASSAYAKMRIQQLMYEVEFPQYSSPAPGQLDSATRDASAARSSTDEDAYSLFPL